jgi:RNA polymerase sigma factor (sigma-70 family)
MASDFLAFTFAQFLVFFLAIVVRREFAAKRLTAAELGDQRAVVFRFIEFGLRGTRATKEDIEDLTQDVLTAAWTTSESDNYRPDPKVRPAVALHSWLWGIARHHVYQYRDSGRVRHEVLSANVGLRVEDAVPSVEDRFYNEEKRHAFMAGLSGVPQHIAAVLIAHDLDGETMADIAERIGTPVSTLYKWRARGLAALRNSLRHEHE